MPDRRTTLRALGLGLLATCGPGGWFRHARAQSITDRSAFSTPLQIPPLDSGNLADATRHYQLALQRGSREFLPGIRTATLGINGDYLGPTLLMQRGEQVAVAVHNQLDEASSLHWHGFHVPAREDGGPNQQIESGATWNPSFRVMQNGGTFWYHSHVLHRAGEQVYRGLAGMILVQDPDQSELGLPTDYGIDDIPLIVQDRRFGDDGSFSYMSIYDDIVKGMHGDTLLVNGTWQPLFQPTTRLVRFRLLNAANARTFLFAFSDNREFYQIASDGGLLEAALPMNRLELAPAERAEILVDFSDGREVLLQSLPMPSGFPVFQGAMSRIMRSLNAQAFDVLRIIPAANLSGNLLLPNRLVSIARLSADQQMPVRQFRLSMGFGSRSGDDRGPGTGARTGLGGGHGGGHSVINGRRMEIGYINETIPLNSTEIWELSNNSPMPHPFHVHHGQFQVLDRNGQPPPANELGWKDTVRVGSGETVRIVMRFEDFADASNPYMYHCHILEHEDQGMMGQFLVV
ncbi:MAG: multicopper oxidase domain-containing protein [Gammaproteobacteria bacterium]|nr:multicopper oxidase domain-containing protein [Pseudomonadales bacterium]MCP5348702.1 multicopper oxidase domain-containing protein [Pseudomonadales bacterium]